MSHLKRISALIFFLLVGGQVMLLPQVYAWCCGYCQCSGGCTCFDPQYPTVCPLAGPCLSDSQRFQLKAPASPDTFSISKPEATDQLIDLARGGECARKNFIANVLTSVRNSFKFEPVHFDEIVAFKVTPSERK